MPSTEYTSEPAVNPLEPVEQLVHWLMTTTIHLAIGLVIGLIAVRVMRSRHLRWTWAATALGVDVLAWPGAGRWHRLDPGYGDAVRDRAWAALAPRRPRRGGRSRRDSRRAPGAAGCGAHPRPPGHAGADGQMGSADRDACVDRDTSGWKGLVQRRPADRRRRGERPSRLDPARRSDRGHAHARGRRHRLGQDGHDDLDGRAGDRARHGSDHGRPQGRSRHARRAARGGAGRAAGRSSNGLREGAVVYNPYARGSETEIADKVLAGEQLHRAALPASGAALPRPRGACAARRPASRSACRALVSISTRRGWSCWRAVCPRQRRERVHDYLDSLTRPSRAVWPVCAIAWRSWPSPTSAPGWTRRRRASSDSICSRPRKRGRSCTSTCESDRRPLLAQMLGAAIVRDLQATVAALQGRPVPTLVVIDEFSAIAPERVVGLFGRAARGGREPRAGHAGARRPAHAGTGAAARAGHGQPVGADRPPPGGARHRPS